MADNLLVVRGLKQYYPVKGGLGKEPSYVKAVDNVDFEVRRGEVFGIVGESGCGKSTLGKSICKLIEPTEGSIVLDGEEISKYTPKQMRPIRKKVQMVFQDPYASLNPRMSVRDIVAEPLIIHHDFVHACSQSCLADGNNLIRHLLCVFLVSRFVFVGFIIEGCSGTAFNIRTDKQFHCSCLSSYEFLLRLFLKRQKRSRLMALRHETGSYAMQLLF